MSIHDAATRLLNKFVGIVNDANRPLPEWTEWSRPSQMGPIHSEHILNLNLPSVANPYLLRSYGTTWYTGLAIGSYIEALTLDAAKRQGVQLLIDRLERALAELRNYQELEHVPQPTTAEIAETHPLAHEAAERIYASPDSAAAESVPNKEREPICKRS